jgi:hypothetical protein
MNIYIVFLCVVSYLHITKHGSCAGTTIFFFLPSTPFVGEQIVCPPHPPHPPHDIHAQFSILS